MGINKHEHFESHMDVSSPETVGDAEKIDTFSEDVYDDLFDKRLSYLDTLECKTGNKTYSVTNLENSKEDTKHEDKEPVPSSNSHGSTSAHLGSTPVSKKYDQDQSISLHDNPTLEYNENRENISIDGSFDALPENRQPDVYKVFENAPSEIKHIVNSLSDELCVDTVIGDDCSYYDLLDRKIRMEEQFDNSEYAEVFSHEYGHFVDDKLGDVSQTIEFKDAMMLDLESFDRSTESGKEKFEEMLNDLMSSDAAYDRAVSDNMSAYFKNDPEVVKRYLSEGIAYYGHESDYWETEGNREAEIYANSFSMSAQNTADSCAFMEKYFPHTWEQFKQSLEGGVR